MNGTFGRWRVTSVEHRYELADIVRLNEAKREEIQRGIELEIPEGTLEVGQVLELEWTVISE